MDALSQTPITIWAAALNLFLAVICGGLIGSERQMRQRMAGLRTNALVALGAASFVVFSSLFPNELSPTRVGAQVVSGIGFLGAGIIFRHGFTVHGLNTAATLWCSAAVGLLAGAGAPAFALLTTGLIMFVNLGLRRVVKFLKSKTRTRRAVVTEAQVHLVCKSKHEGDLRSLILGRLTPPEFMINGLDRCRDDEDGMVTLDIDVTVQGPDDGPLKTALCPLMLDLKVVRLRWDLPGELM